MMSGMLMLMMFVLNYEDRVVDLETQLAEAEEDD